MGQICSATWKGAYYLEFSLNPSRLVSALDCRSRTYNSCRRIQSWPSDGRGVIRIPCRQSLNSMSIGQGVVGPRGSGYHTDRSGRRGCRSSLCGCRSGRGVSGSLVYLVLTGAGGWRTSDGGYGSRPSRVSRSSRLRFGRLAGARSHGDAEASSRVRTVRTRSKSFR
jgi:hypothetical protein